MLNIMWSSKDNDIAMIKAAFKNRIISYKVNNKKYYINVRDFLTEIKDKILAIIENAVQKHFSIKVNVKLFGMYLLDTKHFCEIKSFNTRNEIVLNSSDVEQLYNDFAATLEVKADQFQECDSGNSKFTSNYLIFHIFLF